jgi:thioredoxin-dependent peroxiredoxin
MGGWLAQIADMKKQLTAAAALLALALPAATQAALPQGARAPAFSTQGALGGKPFAFNLRSALRRGPVVLYFYPKAFTQGCTLEARAFAEAHDQFAAAGASVVGMSNDDLPTLQRFSTEECRDKFAVAIATPAIIRAYDVALVLPPEMAARAAAMQGLSSRTSYVIARNGRIRMVHSNLDYRDHVRLTLDAVKALKAAR